MLQWFVWPYIQLIYVRGSINNDYKWAKKITEYVTIVFYVVEHDRVKTMETLVKITGL